MEGPDTGNGIDVIMNVIIIDNSLDVTGAFKAIMGAVEEERSKINFYFYIPHNSKNKTLLEAKGFTVFTFKPVELRRSISSILLYIPFLLINGYKLSRLVKKNKIDWIHQNEVFILTGTVARFFTKVKVLSHIRLMPTIFPKPIFKFWLWMNDKKADRLVAVSQVAKNAARQIYPGKKDITVWYDFKVPVEYYPKYFVKNETPFTIVFIGNYTRGKGQEIALEAIKKLKDEDLAVKIKFYGSHFNYPANIQFKNELQEYIVKNNLEADVELNVFTTDVEAAMKQADVILNLSVAESFSFVVAEALSYGLPVIATNSGGPGELIENNVSGILLENNTVQTLCEQLKMLINNTAKRQSLSDNASYRIRQLILKYGSHQLSQLYK